MHYTHKMLKKYTDRYGNIDLRGTDVTSLPEGLNVKGGLDLRGTNIKALPENLKVGGGLYLSFTRIKSLPANLVVKGDCLNLSYTPIESLPENLKVGGGLWLSHTPIKSLPANLVVGGSLDLSYTPIESLPENLKVEKMVWLAHTPIEARYKNLQVSGEIIMLDNVDDMMAHMDTEQTAHQTDCTDRYVVKITPDNDILDADNSAVRTDVLKTIQSMVSDMIVEGHGGIVKNNTNYTHFQFNESREECLKKVALLYQLIIDAAPTNAELYGE